MIVGTFGNLFAAIESPPVNLDNKPIKFDNLPQPKIFSKNEMSIDGLKKISKEANVMLPKSKTLFDYQRVIKQFILFILLYF